MAVVLVPVAVVLVPVLEQLPVRSRPAEVLVPDPVLSALEPVVSALEPVVSASMVEVVVAAVWAVLHSCVDPSRNCSTATTGYPSSARGCVVVSFCMSGCSIAEAHLQCQA